MRILSGMLGAIVLIGGADAQIAKDPPWNPDHINRLPVEIRNAVLAMCPATQSEWWQFGALRSNAIPQ